MQELKEYWDEAYSSSSERVAYTSPAGDDVTELMSRAIRNDHLWRDFITHCQHRPMPAFNELFKSAQTCIEIGCGTGEFLVGIMSITSIKEGLGMDLSQSAIDHAAVTYATPPKQGQNISWMAGDMMDLMVPQKVDVLIVNQVVEHFRDPKPLIRKFQDLAHFVVVITPYKEQVPKWDADILDGSDNHLISVDESTYSEFDVVEDMVFFSREGWGVSRNGECPLQYAVLIKGSQTQPTWGTFR